MSELFDVNAEAAKLWSAAEHDLEDPQNQSHLTAQTFAQMQTHPNDLASAISKLEADNSLLSDHAQIDVMHINEGRTVCTQFEPGTFELSAKYKSQGYANKTPIECVNGVTPAKFNAAEEARIMRDTAKAEFIGLEQLEPGSSVEQMVHRLAANPDRLKAVALELEKGNASIGVNWFTSQPQAEISYVNGKVSGITFKKAVLSDAYPVDNSSKEIVAKID